MGSNPVARVLTMEIDTAVAKVCARVPEMRDIVEAFAALARGRRDLRIDTADWLDVVDFDPEAFGSGEPLLAGRELPGLPGCFGDAAQKLLPVIERAFPRIGAFAACLRSALTAQPNLGAKLLSAALADDLQPLQAAGGETAIPVATLSFLVREVLKPCLRQAAERIGHLADDDLWCKGRCPVCGAGPDFGLLKEKRALPNFSFPNPAPCGSIARFAVIFGALSGSFVPPAAKTTTGNSMC